MSKGINQGDFVDMDSDLTQTLMGVPVDVQIRNERERLGVFADCLRRACEQEIADFQAGCDALLKIWEQSSTPSLTEQECTDLTRAMQTAVGQMLTARKELHKLHLPGNTVTWIYLHDIFLPQFRETINGRASQIRAQAKEEAQAKAAAIVRAEDEAFEMDLRQRVAHGEYINVEREVKERQQLRRSGQTIPPYTSKYVTPETLIGGTERKPEG